MLDAPQLHQYRLFPINVVGHIAGVPDIIEASDDEQAVQAARRLAGNWAAEIWSGDRLVTIVNQGSRCVRRPGRVFT